jgi:DNA-binding transcriptional LysR family regulator
MNINLEHYKLFYIVAKNKSFTIASNELMISQPGISKAIKILESELNCTLFTRNKGGVVLTEEGKILYENLKPAMDIIYNTEFKMNEIINLNYGVLNIGASKTLIEKYLLPYIEKFHKLYPNIKINIHTDYIDNLIIKSRNGLVDIIFFNFPTNIPDDFKKEKLKEIHDIFVYSNKYKYTGNKNINLSNLANYPLVLLARKSSMRTNLDNICAKNNIILNPAIELTSNTLVEQFVKSGYGIGLLTKEFISNDIYNNLVELKTTPKIPNRYIGLMYIKNKALNKSTYEFLKIIKEDTQEHT